MSSRHARRSPETLTLPAVRWDAASRSTCVRDDRDRTAGASAITPQELRLAARNHGMPLEALAFDETPIGLHYLLIHYDIPRADPVAWRLAIDGAVERPMSLSLEQLRGV